MHVEKGKRILMEPVTLKSIPLDRDVRVDFYFPAGPAQPGSLELLLINDGQDLPGLGLLPMLAALNERNLIVPLLCVGIHAGEGRMMEYGVAAKADFGGRGAKAALYTDFIFSELIPYIREHYRTVNCRRKAFAGFSMGALSALDIVWSHPGEFVRAGLFSGSFWWRSKDAADPSYDDHYDRIMHMQIREGSIQRGLKFFFECGGLDETADRNGNGIIDAIDDTQDLIAGLVGKGYDAGKDIRYLELPDGRHDLATWARAMPVFLEWGWGR